MSEEKNENTYEKSVKERLTGLIKEAHANSSKQEHDHEMFFDHESGGIDFEMFCPDAEQESLREESLCSILISDAFASVARGKSFVERCIAQGKIYLNQLSDEDFANVRNLRGIGTVTVEQLKKIYLDFSGMSKIQNDHSGLEALPESVEQITDLGLSRRAVNALTRKGIHSVDDMRTLSEKDLFNIRNLGAKTVSEIMSRIIELFPQNQKSSKTINNENCEYTLLTHSTCHENSFGAGVLSDQSNNLTISYNLSYFPLPLRVQNVLSLVKITTLNDLISLDENDIGKIKGVPAKTLSEILTFRRSMMPSRDMDASKMYSLNDICMENRKIPISLLSNIGLSEQGIDSLINEGYGVIGDLCNIHLNLNEYMQLYPIEHYFGVPIAQRFNNSMTELNAKTKFCLSGRSRGETLETIGNQLNISRERVRQILQKAYLSLSRNAILVAGSLISIDKAIFSMGDLIRVFDSEEQAVNCKLTLETLNYVNFVQVLNVFVRTSLSDTNIEVKLKERMESIIGDGINMYDNLEIVEDELTKLGLSSLEFSDILSLLESYGYRLYGDYLAKEAQSYSVFCIEAIKNFFAFDIKLDADENSDDLLKLRQLIKLHYPGASLPTNNRALASRIASDSTKMVLSGRGRYCPIEKVIINVPLFKEIYDFIFNSSQDSFYYAELFSYFQTRLEENTNITNPSFLHGVLKHLYPLDFTYERDLLSKSGKIRQSLETRLSDLLRGRKEAFTRTEIREVIPGLNDSVITFAVSRMPELILWDYNEFTHVANIDMTDSERNQLLSIIELQEKLNNGYLSDTMFLEAAMNSMPEFMAKNNIKKEANLYYFAAYLFGERYRFKRPHIVAHDFPVAEITSLSIVKALLDCDRFFNYEEYIKLASYLGWSSATAYSVYNVLTTKYVRISENEYELREHFNIPYQDIVKLSEKLDNLTGTMGYFAVNRIRNYMDFPKLAYAWNGFLLETIITEMDIDFRLITTKDRDRRYIRGIIVPRNCDCVSLDELLVNCFHARGIRSISEAELLQYLNNNCLLTTDVVPKELYESQHFKFQKGFFIL